jgi:putative peptidoglycan lipid II flippase
VRRLSRAAGAVSVATLVSRLLGLLRESVRAALLGSAQLSDAVDVAFRVPNLLRDLFAEGAFSGAFVPTLSRERRRAGDASAIALVNRAGTTLLLYVALAVGLLALFAPQILAALTSREFQADPERSGPAVRLTRLLAPFLLFVCAAVVAMGALNVFGRFFLPALSSAAQNAVLVGGGGALLAAGVAGPEAATPWALLLLAGGACQFLVQVPALRREGWRPRFAPDLAMRDPAVREILRRMAPVVVGLAATHACILVNQRLATEDVGGASYLAYGFRLVHLPVGLIGVAVGTAVLAQASAQAARGDAAAVGRTLGDGLGLCLAFAMPASAGMAVLADPIAQLLFRHGATRAHEASAIGEAIRFYAPAVVFYCCVRVVVPVFQAQGRLRVPVLAALAAVAANLSCGVPLHALEAWRWRGLALALGAGQAANLLVLLAAVRESFGRPPRASLVGLAKIAAATALSAGASYAALRAVPPGPSLASRAFAVFSGVGAGAAVYLAAGYALRCREILAALGLAARRVAQDGKAE